jgi:hypothetical protein
MLREVASESRVVTTLRFPAAVLFSSSAPAVTTYKLSPLPSGLPCRHNRLSSGLLFHQIGDCEKLPFFRHKLAALDKV